MILHSTPSVIRHQICGKLSTGAGSGLLILMFEKLNLFQLTGLITRDESERFPFSQKNPLYVLSVARGFMGGGAVNPLMGSRANPLEA